MSTSTSAPDATDTLVVRCIRRPRLPFGPCSPEAFEQLRAMTPAERVAALYAGELTYAQCCRWASWRPHEVPRINGEFAYLAAFDEAA
ncbi:MAG: hypothetical protein QOJ97_245 [Solirubrobacteraceae bacterium]|jgi:hypothetical protein|nr:hypothetical protein [Solirubrobacteraceae bacterium]